MKGVLTGAGIGFALLLVAVLIFLICHDRPGGVYIVRTRKPGSPWGLPIIGRHFAYVGETSSFKHRERQHTGKYLATDTFRVGPGKPWRDLDPIFYRVPMPFKWLRKVMETVFTWILCPVYNVRKQPPWNFRRMSITHARRLHAVRANEATGWWMPRAVASLRVYHIVGLGLVAAGLYLGVIR